MASGDVIELYRTASALTVTGLPTLAGNSSATAFTSGLGLATINNASNDLDCLISAHFRVNAGSPAAGEIRVYAYLPLDLTTPTYPSGLFSSGTAGALGALTVTDTEQLACAMGQPLWTGTTDATASRWYQMPPTSIRLAKGFMPRNFALYIAHYTGASNLALQDAAVWHQFQSNNIAA